MAGTQKNLNVQWFPQQTLYFCGPAVAQMFLDYVNVTVTQPDLWTDIRNNTGGKRPGDAPASGHEFPQQVCDNCNPASNDPRRWACWDTTPEALGVAVGMRGTVGLGARYASKFDEGVELLIDSLDGAPEVPAFATTYIINHWVLVKGYVRDDFTSTSAPAQTVGRYKLNGIYVSDPQASDPVDRVRFVTVNGWRGQFGLIACGPHIDTYPVVIRSARVASWVWYVLILISMLFLYSILRWYVGS
jgi:hypothetical protein